MQAHFSHLPLPNADYQTDTKSVLDQAIRILQVCTQISSKICYAMTNRKKFVAQYLFVIKLI